MLHETSMIKSGELPVVVDALDEHTESEIEDAEHE